MRPGRNEMRSLLRGFRGFAVAFRVGRRTGERATLGSHRAGSVDGAVVVVIWSAKRLSCFRKYSVCGSGSKHFRICSTASSRRPRRKRTSARASMKATLFGSEFHRAPGEDQALAELAVAAGGEPGRGSRCWRRFYVGDIYTSSCIILLLTNRKIA